MSFWWKVSKPTGIVLAGGESRRLGKDKALLEVGGHTLLSRAIILLQPLAGEVLVIGPERSCCLPYPVLFVNDMKPHLGPLAGLHTGLLASPSERNLVVPVDMPFLNRSHLEMLLAANADAQAAVYRVHGRLQPLPARVDRNCTPIIENMMQAGDLALEQMLKRVPAAIIDSDDEDLAADIDTNEDLRNVWRLAGGKPAWQER